MSEQQCVGYFQFDAEEHSIAMVLKDYWDTHSGLDGDGIDDRLIPAGFYALAESIYESDMATDKAKAALVAAGWEERELIPDC